MASPFGCGDDTPAVDMKLVLSTGKKHLDSWVGWPPPPPQVSPKAGAPFASASCAAQVSYDPVTSQEAERLKDRS